MGTERIGQQNNLETSAKPEAVRITSEERRANHDREARRLTTPLDGVVDERNIDEIVFGIDQDMLHHAATPDANNPAYIHSQQQEKLGKLVFVLNDPSVPNDSGKMSVLSRNLSSPS